ncbi:MAG TPA: cupredoxin domain-containing protein [Nitrososphaeraceae archaeon]|jgi:hypothetical protein
MSVSSPQNVISEGKLVAIGLVGGIAALVLFFVLISGGLVRHVPITWQEKIETTVAFKTIDGQLKVIGIIGNSGINPTLLMRTKDFAMVLTVINQDNIPHMLYIDGLGVNTKILKAGENQTITFYSPTEGTYNYYDRLSSSKPIGQIKAVKVTQFE